MEAIASSEEFNGVPLLALALFAILNPVEPARHKADHVATIYNCRVAAEVTRRLINSKFPLHKLPRNTPETTRETIRLEADLWVAVWEMLKEMGSAYNVLWDHPVNIFFQIVKEFELVSPWMAQNPKIVDFQGASHWHKTYQPRINSKLADRNNKAENPFCQPTTRRFIDAAFYLVDRCEGFNENFYKPMVKTRKSLVARLREENPKAHDANGKPALKGAHDHPIDFKKRPRKTKKK